MTVVQKLLAGGAALALFASPALAQDTLIIEDFIGTISVDTNAGSSINVVSAENDRDVSYDEDGDTLTINGGIDDFDYEKCAGYHGSFNLSWFGRKESSGTFGGYDDLEEYPNIVLDADTDLTLVVRDSIVFGDVGDLKSTDIEMDYCGRLSLGDLSGDARIQINGSGDVTMGSADKLDARINGSGDIEADDLGEADLEIRGSGDIETGAIDRTLNLTVRGSGDVETGPVSGEAKIQSNGSGDIYIESAQGLTYSGNGSGDFGIDYVSGSVSLSVNGSGDIDVDDGDITDLTARSNGSGDIYVDATAETAILRASGSSDIYVDRVTGDTDISESHSADVDIGNR